MGRLCLRFLGGSSSSGGVLDLVDQPAFDSEFPSSCGATCCVVIGGASLRSFFSGKCCVGDENSQFPFLFHGTLESLLDVQPFPHDGRIQFALEGQQVHVGLGLGNQLPDFLWQDFVGKFPLLFNRSHTSHARTGATSRRF